MNIQYGTTSSIISLSTWGDRPELWGDRPGSEFLGFRRSPRTLGRSPGSRQFAVGCRAGRLVGDGPHFCAIETGWIARTMMGDACPPPSLDGGVDSWSWFQQCGTLDAAGGSGTPMADDNFGGGFCSFALAPPAPDVPPQRWALWDGGSSFPLAPPTPAVPPQRRALRDGGSS